MSETEVKPRPIEAPKLLVPEAEKLKIAPEVQKLAGIDFFLIY